MRKLIGITSLIAFALSNVGCIAAIGNKGPVTTCAERQAVVIQDTIYIVDVDDGTVQKVDEHRLSSAGPFQPAEKEVTD